jgi:integrase
MSQIGNVLKLILGEKKNGSGKEDPPMTIRQVFYQLVSAGVMEKTEREYVLALDSGMRQGELFGLHWSEVDFNSDAVLVTRSLEELSGHQRMKDVKTKSSRRRIKLTPRTITALNRHRQQMLSDGRDVKAGPVFLNADGGLIFKSSFRTWSFLKVLGRAKLLDESGRAQIRFHDLRHTCATLLLSAGENAKVVSERLGHSSIKITLDTYAHVMPGMQDAAVEKMAKILGMGSGG